MKRFCSQCGSTIEADALFCDNCGAEVQSRPTAAAGAQRPAEPANPASPASRPLAKLALLAAAGTVLAAIGGGIYWFTGDAGPSTRHIQAAFDEWASHKPAGLSLTNAQHAACSRRANRPIRRDGSDIVWYAAVSKQYPDAPHGVVVIDPRWSNLVNALLATGVAQAPVVRTRDGLLAMSGQRVVIVAHLTEAGAKLAREGLLCFGDSVAFGELRRPPTVIDYEGTKVALALVAFRLAEPHPWIDHPAAKPFADGARRSEISLVMEKTGAGWALVTDANRERKILSALAANVVAAAKSPANTDSKRPHSTVGGRTEKATAPSGSPGLWRRTSDWFGGLFGGSSLVGTWEDAKEQLEFFENGKVTARLKSEEGGLIAGGTWTELRDGRIRLDLQVHGLPIPPMFVTRQGDQLHVFSSDGPIGTLVKVK